MNKPQNNENRDPYMRHPTKGTNSVTDNSKVMNLYGKSGNSSRQIPDTQRDFGRGTTHQIPDTQRDFGRGTTHQGSAQNYNRIERKPLFSNGGTAKPVLNSHSEIDKTKVLTTNGSLMKVESIAECSLWSILQYF